MAAGPVPILGVPRQKDEETDTPESGHGPDARESRQRETRK